MNYYSFDINIYVDVNTSLVPTIKPSHIPVKWVPFYSWHNGLAVCPKHVKVIKNNTYLHAMKWQA